MRPIEIQKQLKQYPFIPFRMYFSDGSWFEIRHPEMAIVTRTVISLAVHEDPNSDLPERAILCDPVHVTRLEPINTAPGLSPGESN